MTTEHLAAVHRLLMQLCGDGGERQAAAAASVRGIGCDVVSISGFGEQLQRPGTRFESVFTATELRSANRAPDRSAHLAARWAAKEAVVKAWSSTRFGYPPGHNQLDLSEIEVVQDRWSRPRIRLHGAVAASLLTAQITLSLSHDQDADVAIAVVFVGFPDARRPVHDTGSD